VPVADPWAKRIGQRICQSASPLVLVTGSGEGVKRALEAVSGDGRLLVWVDLADTGDADDISAGNRFVDAVNRATGANLLARGTPMGVAVRAFQRLADLLGPFVIGVRSGDAADARVGKLVELHDGDTVVAVVAPRAVGCRPSGCLAEVPDEDLRISGQEAAWFVSGRLEASAVEAVVEEHSGDYVRVVSALRKAVGLPPLWSEPWYSSMAVAREEFGIEPRPLAEALLRRKRYLEAFKIMCADARDLIPHHIEVCGEAFFERGQFDHFWSSISCLGADDLNDERTLRWYFAAAMAVNRHGDVVPMVESFLRVNEAPELRALYAASNPSREFLAETTRAVSVLETPITLRHHAFALSLAGKRDEASDTLHRALRLADLLGNDQLVVALATDMCIALQRTGAYRDSLWWGEWAFAEYSRRGLSEGYRRVTAIAALVFSKLLAGDGVGLRDMVDEIEISADLAGVPSYEGVLSVVADFFTVTDDLARAVEFYKLAFESSSYDILGLIAVDYVCCLVAMGDIEMAREVGAKVVALSRYASTYQRACGVLAMGIAMKAAGDAGAGDALKEAVHGFVDGSDAVRLGQACIHLAELHLLRDDEEQARQTIMVAGTACDELGDSGWKLLAGTSAAVHRLRQFVTDAPAGARFLVLGKPEVKLFGLNLELTARQLEIIVILAHSAGGLALGALAVALYGDRAVVSTAKAAVSRLRSTIPLTSRPYQIAVPFRADFLDLMEHLQQGRVRQALSLYRGPLLPDSEAPAVVELREHIDEALRQAVLASGDHEAMLELANRTDDQDLELLEAAASHMPQNDPQWPLLRARIRQIRRDWGSDDDFNR
jgi:tetratricopeptide (TPR) repeat protein